MSRDWFAVDKRIQQLLRRWRAACIEPSEARLPLDEQPNPLLDPMLRPERMAELRECDDPVALAIEPWASCLVEEQLRWRDRCSLAALWHQPHPVSFDTQPQSAAALRAGLLATSDFKRRQLQGQALSRIASPISDFSIASIQRRREGPGGRCRLVTDGYPADTATLVAERLLKRTDDAAEELMHRGWVEGIHATMGAQAAEGWPARMQHRWLAEAFAGTGLTDGLRLHAPPLPVARGSMSFANALGRFGMAVLEAGRPDTMPLALHRHPRGLRQRRRFSLFAATAGELSFAAHVLGLGRDRARRHQRTMARAAVASLRIAASRIVLEQALQEGEDAARSCFAETTARLFGEPAPATLFGVLPQLSTHDAPALLGAIMAGEDRHRLIEEHDVDWFRSPRAIATLRAADSLPRAPGPHKSEGLLAATDRVTTLLLQLAD